MTVNRMTISSVIFTYSLINSSLKANEVICNIRFFMNLFKLNKVFVRKSYIDGYEYEIALCLLFECNDV